MATTYMVYGIYSPLNIYERNIESVNFIYQIGTIKKIPNSLCYCEDSEVKSCVSQILV